MGFTALYDACVLYPAALRDLLIQLAGTGLFRARWSEDIEREWMAALQANRPDILEAAVGQTRDRMRDFVLDCLVTGYDALIPTLELPDSDDRHVLAAAIVGRADLIVTNNVRDFPELVTRGYGIEVKTADEFILDLTDLDITAVLGAAEQIRARLRSPEKTWEEYLGILERNGLLATCERLRQTWPRD